MGLVLNLKKNFFIVFSISLVLSIAILYGVGVKLVMVLTDSMEPTIPRGSLVLVLPYRPLKNDVVLYKLSIAHREYLVLHRVIKCLDWRCSRFYTKGDNRFFRDPWSVSEENVLGVAVLSIPFLGYVFLILKPISILLLVFIAVYRSTQILISKVIKYVRSR